jgi:hypothetical protein
LKDFIFSDPSESTSKVVLRTDLIGSNINFSIMKISGLGPTDVKSHQHKKRALLAQGWHEGTYLKKSDLVTLATSLGLDLVIQDSNGENPEILVDYNSDFGASSW